MRFVSVLCAAALLAGCTSAEPQVLADIRSLEQSEFGRRAAIQVLSAGPGEGDSDNVYYHLELFVTAKEDVAVSRGPFKGLTLRRGEKSPVIRLEVLYQWRDGAWRRSADYRQDDPANW